MAKACFAGRLQLESVHHPDFSPLLFPSHANLPPLVMQICGLDPLRDEAFLYQKILEKEGIKTKGYVYVPPHLWACARRKRPALYTGIPAYLMPSIYNSLNSKLQRSS